MGAPGAVGFTLLYLPALDAHIAIEGSTDAGFWQAFYLSGASISTVGFGDIIATTAPYQIATIAESLIGFALLTLSISYILNIYEILREKGVLAILLRTDQGNDEALVQRHLRAGSLDQFAGAMSWIHERFAHQYEGIRRYPPLYYFWSHEDERSLPNLVRKIGRLAAAARWTPPQQHPMTMQPSLLNFIDNYDTIVARMSEDLGIAEADGERRPVTFEVFRDVLDREARARDDAVKRFLALERAATQATDADPGTPEERYERYAGWFRVVALAEGFYAAASQHLGYDDDD